MEREKELYANTEKLGGWVGWRQFRVTKRVKESDNITSFYLTPTEGEDNLPQFLPGQYIAVSCVPGGSDGYRQARQYVLHHCDELQ